MVTSILQQWTKWKVTRFRNDYAAGMHNIDLAAKYKISTYSVWRIETKLGLIGSRGSRCCEKVITQDIAELIERMYPTNGWQAISIAIQEQFGVKVCKSTITNYANLHGWHKDEDYLRQLQEQKGRSIYEKWIANHDDVIRKRTETLKATIRAEHRRMHHDLPQKTGLQLTIVDPKLRSKRRNIKHGLVFVNNYFSDGKGSNNMYYDEQTKRSRYMERKYANMFNFYPADGFDEAQSRWTKKINYGTDKSA